MAKQSKLQIRTSAQIAERNDAFRTTMIPAKWNKIIFSEMVREEDEVRREKILTAVREFNFKNQEEGNNPYGENDFGKVIVGEINYFFKFDYYAPGLEFGADPYTEQEVVHVLTIMEASEY